MWKAACLKWTRTSVRCSLLSRTSSRVSPLRFSSLARTQHVPLLKSSRPSILHVNAAAPTLYVPFSLQRWTLMLSVTRATPKENSPPCTWRSVKATRPPLTSSVLSCKVGPTLRLPCLSTARSPCTSLRSFATPQWCSCSLTSPAWTSTLGIRMATPPSTSPQVVRMVTRTAGSLLLSSCLRREPNWSGQTMLASLLSRWRRRPKFAPWPQCSSKREPKSSPSPKRMTRSVRWSLSRKMLQTARTA
mmetsp:Transcript_14215/g.45578  ORF Transcript_14215/g.45578 Transcript_14215/m.45578 type:complete len:246 (-) Transcript_14215:175-912(-)